MVELVAVWVVSVPEMAAAKVYTATNKAMTTAASTAEGLALAPGIARGVRQVGIVARVRATERIHQIRAQSTVHHRPAV